MKTNHLVLFICVSLLSFAISASAEGTTAQKPIAVDPALIISVLAPLVVAGLKKIPGLFASRVSRNLLPYACIGVAVLLTLLLDFLGKTSMSVWVAGPVAGAIGIGARELLDKGMGLLGIGTTGVADKSGIPEAEGPK